MKKLKILMATCSLMLASLGVARAGRTVYQSQLVNESGLAYNNVYSLDLSPQNPSVNGGVDSISFEATYTSATFTAQTFTDGVKSTGSITVSSYTALNGARGTNTLTVASYPFVSANAIKFTFRGVDFPKGDLWLAGASSITVANNIAAAINSFTGVNSLISASTTSNGVVTLTCIASGTVCNSYTLTTSSAAALTAGAATFTGGLDPTLLVIAGQTLTTGVNFNAVTSSATTAKNISDAIQANATLAAIISSTWSAAGVVTTTSTAAGSGTKYRLWSSSQAALAVFAPQMAGGTDSAIASNVFTKASHGFTTGLQVLYTASAGTDPQNLIAGTSYYVIKVDANSFKLATTMAKATTTVPVPITISTFTTGGSFTLTPLVITGTPSFKWEVSNDNTNWTTLTTSASNVSLSSVTVSAYTLGGASSSWDFGPIAFRYVRLNVVAPTQGGLFLVVTGNGKSNY
jgi:hypothetical protein